MARKSIAAYSASAYTVGHMYNGWTCIKRKRIHKLWRFLYDGKPWLFVFKK